MNLVSLNLMGFWVLFRSTIRMFGNLAAKILSKLPNITNYRIFLLLHTTITARTLRSGDHIAHIHTRTYVTMSRSKVIQCVH